MPYPAGGAGDAHARLIGQALSPLLGQPVVVENRAGAAGNLGADHVAKAAPDGHTLLMNTTNLTIAPAFSSKLPFNVLTDLAPISTSLTSQNLLVVRTALPVRSIAELVGHAKANPGKLSFGSSGIGRPMLTMELLKTLGRDSTQPARLAYRINRSENDHGRIGPFPSQVVDPARFVRYGGAGPGWLLKDDWRPTCDWNKSKSVWCACGALFA